MSFPVTHLEAELPFMTKPQQFLITTSAVICCESHAHQIQGEENDVPSLDS
jgi:hypothetical protein